MDPGSVFTAGAPGTLDGAKAGDGERGGSLSRLDEVMLFVAVCHRYGSACGLIRLGRKLRQLLEGCATA